MQENDSNSQHLNNPPVSLNKETLSPLTLHTEKVYTHSFSFFLNLIRSLRRAKKTITIDIYIIARDRLGKLIFSELLKAAQRGVSVKLLVDGIGSKDFALSCIDQVSNPQFSMRVYNPIPWPFSRFYLKELLSPSKFFLFLSLLNRRNHKKIVVIDHQTAFLGSHNLFNQAMTWRETGVKIQNPHVIEDLNKIFNWTWERSFHPTAPRTEKKQRLHLSSDNLYFTSRFKNRRLLRSDLLKKIATAKVQIQITMAYFYPSLAFIKELKKASHRGVHVDIILPRKSDVWFFPRVSRVLYASLLSSNIRIYEFKKMLHAKQILIDNWAIVGSSNLNPRSLLHDLEIDYVLSSENNVAELVQQFALDKEQSQEISLEILKNKTWSMRLNSLLASLFKNWI